MTGIIERLRSSSPYLHGSSAERAMAEAAAEIERLKAALEPFARNVDAVSLSATLGHITREDLWRARAALEPKP